MDVLSFAVIRGWHAVRVCVVGWHHVRAVYKLAVSV